MLKFQILFYCILFGGLVSQEDSISLKSADLVKNSVYCEFVGNATLYSLNYDRIVVLNDHITLAATVGTTYIYGENSHNSGVKGMLSMPDELNHAKFILGGNIMLRKELFWKLFKIERQSKNPKKKISFLELGYYHIWNNPKTSPANLPGGTFERGHPWNNIYIGYNLFRTKPGVFVRFGAVIYMFKKGPNVIDEISSGYRISPLPFPRLMVGYAF